MSRFQYEKPEGENPTFQKPVLTKEELEEQDRVANEILDEILRETR